MSDNHVEDLKRLLKVAFVPMPGGQAEPVAGAGMLTAAAASGGIGGGQGAMPPGDPNAMPPEGDPGMMPPEGDPGMMPPGGDPGMMPPGDPGMLLPPEGDPGMPPGDGGMVQLTGNQLIDLIAALKDGPVSKKPSSSGGAGGVEAKLDRILARIEGGMGQPM